MQRRDFVRLAGLTGLSLFMPSVLGRGSVAHADGATWGGPFLLHMHASGGWDPTILCDAKLTAGGNTPVYENKLVTAVQDINGISVPTETAAGKFLLRSNNNPVEDPQNFFTTVGKDVLVFNGVDTQTNNHDTGTQAGACGHNDIELPALAALFAGFVAKQRDIPMAFLASGQYNRTGDVVGISRFSGDKIALLTEPYKANPNDEKALLSDVAIRRMAELRQERFGKIESQATLPRTKRTFGAMRDAAKGGASLNLLKQVVGQTAPTIDTFANDLAPDTRAYLTASQNANGPARFIDLGRDVEVILRCFQAGVSASATYAQGGFDTHSDHDTNQQNAMGQFLAKLRYVLLRSAQMNLKNQLYILVTSDFGRTPRYNTGNGKDHWNVTSTLLIGPGIRGGRAIGKTDEGHKALRVSKSNPSQVLPDGDANGSRIHQGHLHRELRRVLGLEQASFINQFPLPATDTGLPLLA